MDFKKFFQEPGTITVLISSGFIGLLAGVANGVVQKKHGGWQGFFSSLLMGVLIAVIAGLAIQEYIKSEALRLAIVGGCAVIADDIVAGLRTFGEGVRTDPFGAVARLIDALRGRSTAAVKQEK